MIYVTLPDDFVATVYPGYFWHLKEQELYSIKIGGILKKLKMERPNRFNKISGPGYRISHKGIKRFIPYGHLSKIRGEHSVIPEWKRTPEI